MKTIYKGIPTEYNGIKFRSKLEAQWAAFFDLLGWKYEYEPYALNGWIPDFIIYGKESNSRKTKEILVEVKPFSKLEEFKETVEKIRKSMLNNDKREILLLGNTIFESKEKNIFDDSSTSCSIGWLVERTWYDNDNFNVNSFDECILNYYNEKFGFFHVTDSYQDRITGLHDGDHFLRRPDYTEVKKVLWNRAKNMVQWKKQ
ncbi:MAG: hypothetical protein ACFFG0_50605 [Candidatus Thorarchaeota archaeon]